MSCWNDVEYDTILKQTYILKIIQDDEYLICDVGIYIFLQIYKKNVFLLLTNFKTRQSVYKIMSCWTDVKSDTILKQTYILMIIQDDKYLICVVGLYLFLRISDFNTRLYYYVVNQKRPTDGSIKHFFMKSMMVNLSYIRRILDNFHILVLLDLSIQLMKW